MSLRLMSPLILMRNWLNHLMELLMVDIFMMRNFMRHVNEMFYYIVMSWNEFDMGLDNLMMFSVRMVLVVMNHMVWSLMMLDMLAKTMLR